MLGMNPIVERWGGMSACRRLAVVLWMVVSCGCGATAPCVAVCGKRSMNVAYAADSKTQLDRVHKSLESVVRFASSGVCAFVLHPEGVASARVASLVLPGAWGGDDWEARNVSDAKPPSCGAAEGACLGKRLQVLRLADHLESDRCVKRDRAMKHALRTDLSNLMNFARVFVDRFLLPLGVKRVLYFDADTVVTADLKPWYSMQVEKPKFAVALHRDTCKNSCGFRVGHPLVAATSAAGPHEGGVFTGSSLVEC